MQVGRGGTQVEGVSYVHRILAVITPHTLTRLLITSMFVGQGHLISVLATDGGDSNCK